MTATATIRPASAAAAITGAVAWITIALAVGLSGVLATARTPGPQLLILALTVTTLWMTSRGGLRTLIDAIPIRTLVAFHALRLGGVAFLAVSATGTLSPLFATNAGWGDIAAGAGAIVLAASFAPDTPMRRRLYLGWNVFATLDLLVAVGTATLVALRGDVPGMSPLFTAPLILVPTFMVPVLLATHVIIFRRLRGPTANEDK